MKLNGISLTLVTCLNSLLLKAIRSLEITESTDCKRVEGLGTRKKSHLDSYKLSTGPETNKENKNGLNDFTYNLIKWIICFRLYWNNSLYVGITFNSIMSLYFNSSQYIKFNDKIKTEQYNTIENYKYNIKCKYW